MNTNPPSRTDAHAAALPWVEEDHQSLARQLVLCQTARQPWQALESWALRAQAAFSRRAVSLVLMAVLVSGALSQWVA